MKGCMVRVCLDNVELFKIFCDFNLLRTIHTTIIIIFRAKVVYLKIIYIHEKKYEMRSQLSL